jgi:hypothetical protein
MASLREIQGAFRGVLLDGAAAPADLGIAEDGLTVEARLAIYRHHVLASLTAVLESTYPVVCRLVDRRFFAYAADAFIRQRPPEGPCLFEYGAALPEFLAEFPACRHLAYLVDVARLEWAMHGAAHAGDAVPLAPAALEGIDRTRAGELRFDFDPSVTLLSSRWPIDRIWRANQDGAEDVVDLDAGGVSLEVRRSDDVVVFRALTETDYAFRRALLDGASLAAAAERALDVDETFDLPGALGALVHDGVLTGAVMASTFERRSSSSC